MAQRNMATSIALLNPSMKMKQKRPAIGGKTIKKQGVAMVNKQPGVIVDCDGTLCDVTSIRHHVLGRAGKKKDFDAFHSESIDCPPHQFVVDLVVDLNHHHDILVVTARRERWWWHTKLWLVENDVPHTGLFMRGDDDHRPDYEVKLDILKTIQKTHDVVLAIDDNPSVIDLWKEQKIDTLIVPGWID